MDRYRELIILILHCLICDCGVVSHCTYSCGNVAAILEIDENLRRFYKIFDAAPQDTRGVPAKKATPDYFL